MKNINSVYNKDFTLCLETHLFNEPGIYMSMMNGVALQGFKASSFTHEMIKG